MCDPVSLTLAATAVSVVGQGVSAYSSHQQANYEARVANQNARLQNENALDAIKRGEIEQRRSQQQTSRLIGSQRAAMGANGIDLSFGNAADFIGDTASYGAEDAATIRENAMREAHGFEINSANFRSEALSARRRATGALIQGAFGMASTALGGATQAAKLGASAGG